MPRKSWILIVFLLIAGCAAASGTITPITMTPLSIEKSDQVALTTTSTAEKGGKYIDALNYAVSSGLADVQFSQRAEAGLDPADLIIEMDITEVREVGGGTRFMFGALAGQAGISVNVVVRNGADKRELGQFVATGKSSGGSIFAGTTNQAVRQVADQIVSFVTGVPIEKIKQDRKNSTKAEG